MPSLGTGEKAEKGARTRARDASGPHRNTVVGIALPPAVPSPGAPSLPHPSPASLTPGPAKQVPFTRERSIGMRNILQLLHNIKFGVILEVRDPRAPISSAHPYLGRIASRAKIHFIVYTRADLLSDAERDRVMRYTRGSVREYQEQRRSEHATSVFFVDTSQARHMPKKEREQNFEPLLEALAEACDATETHKVLAPPERARPERASGGPMQPHGNRRWCVRLLRRRRANAAGTGVCAGDSISDRVGTPARTQNDLMTNAVLVVVVVVVVTRGGGPQGTHRTREPHQEGQGRAQQTRRRGTARKERQPEQREQGTRMEGMVERAHGRQQQ